MRNDLPLIKFQSNEQVIVDEHTLFALINGPGKVPPASVVLDENQYEAMSDRRPTYERKKPSGAIFALEIVKLVTVPTELRGRSGQALERDTMDAAWVIERSEKKDIKGRYIRG